MTSPVVVLAAHEVARLLDMGACIESIAGAFSAHEAGGSRGPASCGFALPDGSFHVKAAALESDGRLFVLAKANVNLPGNSIRHGRPTIQGALLLFDGLDGRPLAVMDSMALTSLRTAATAALAARHLSLHAAGTITIVGCGEQGEAQLRAITTVRPLTTAFAVDTDAAKAADFARRLSRDLRLRVEATTDLGAAVLASDICVTATTAHEPFVARTHLHPGLFIAAVGADNPAKHEIQPEALRHSRVVVDSLAACAAGGDLHHAIASGAMSEADVHAELSAIVAGRAPGRSSPDEVFVFDSTGTALQDAGAAVAVYQRALAAGLGRRVHFVEPEASATTGASW